MSILQLTDVQIANEALKRLGQTSGLVTAVDGTDTSPNGQLIYPTYDRVRDAELRSHNWAPLRKRAELTQAQITLQNCSWTSGSDAIVVSDSTGIVVGWVIGSQLIQGNPPAIPPTGIPQGTTVKAITDGTHVQMSANATASGSGQLVFQVDNETGFWFAYTLPDDALRLTDVYAVYPASTYLYPFRTIHTVGYPFIFENPYIYTDIFTESPGSAIAEYIYEPSAGTPPFGMDFVDALSLRLASTLCVPVTQDLNLKKDIDAEYIAVLNRALGTAKREEAQAHLGDPWWR